MQGRTVKPRRGAITVMTALVFFALVACMGVAIDFSRLWIIRNELQTGADAGSLAGAMQMMSARDTLRFADSALAYARANRTLTDTLHVDSVQKGFYDGATRVFTAAGTPTNAVNVVVSYDPSRMWMRSFGATIPRMKARAVAWAGAPASNTAPECVKPWAMPYETLMSAVNTFRGIANTNANLTRAWDQVNDVAALNRMTLAQRTFSLKIAQNLGNVNQAGATAGSMPGNYQAVRLGKLWDYGTQTYSAPPPQNGGSSYSAWINGTNGCPTLAVGDSLETEPGNKVGPTVSAVQPTVCATITDNNGANLATHGNCNQSNGSVGKDIITAFYTCGSGCTGQSTVGVKLTGSFTLMKLYPDNDAGRSPRWDKSQIVGVFKPLHVGGAGGGGSTTLVKLVLAR